MTDPLFDLFIIGGGINGAGIARDAAGRGYAVCLAEMDDLASGTSSAATKLVHGGLRYLEQAEFKLVRQSLLEREVLWAMAPHLVRPLRFVLPHHRGVRPAFVLRAGLALYDGIGGRRKLPPTRTIDLQRDVAGQPLLSRYRIAFEYSDCWVDDARLVILNARDAADRGAQILVRTKVISARREDGVWAVEVADAASGRRQTIRARMLVNAAGPGVDTVRRSIEGQAARENVRLVKGSHIVVKRLFEHDKCYILQNSDKRIVFAIPYEQDFTLIGTTDVDYLGDPTDAGISGDEIDYLLKVIRAYFRKRAAHEDIVWAFSGVRPLFDDGEASAQEITREFVLRLERGSDDAPLLNIFGGKLTTYRTLAEEALDRIVEAIGAKGSAWTAGSHLPGGDFAMDGFEAQFDRLLADYPFLTPRLARRLLRLYGTLARIVLGDAQSGADLGKFLGADLSMREVDYLVANEWARTAEDILWRRTKLGLQFDTRATKRLETYLAGLLELQTV